MSCNQPFDAIRTAAVVLSFLTALSGCGRENARLGIQGHVTFDGAPVPDGRINFIPLPGTSSPTAGASIRDGTFEVPANKGVRPGKFRVEIRAIRATGKTMKDDLSGAVIAKKEPYIPKRYNDASELVADIKAGEANHLEYKLSGS